jgi:hypothetical protein
MKQAVSVNDLSVDDVSSADLLDADGTSLLLPLLRERRSPNPEPGSSEPIHGVVVGELLAIADDGTVPLIRYEGQPGAAALRARTTIDLHGQHIGSPVVLMFDRGDPSLPIVLGVLRVKTGWPKNDPPALVEVDANGQRMIVSACEQLVLRCGKASITLTSAGKVIVEGSYLVSRSTGINRIKGGSVQLN